jgi:4-hydroxyphenylpyruvate dioxygenase
MRKGIATVSLSGLLADKLTAVAAAGFDGIELFDNDLVSSPLSPREVATRCADLGLTIDLFQPVRDVQGVAPERFEAVLHRVRTKLEVMAQLGTWTFLACSNVDPSSSADPGLTAEQLHRVGALAAEYGVTVAFEALAWGAHVNRVGQAWDAVVRADHPAVTLAVDTFHMLARGDSGEALAGIPGSRIGFLQVADAPLLDMNVLEWSRHFRCFPGEGTLDVTGVVAATLAARYTGPLSLEVFSDVVREADPAVTAREAMRSLVFLEDQVAGVLGGATPVGTGLPGPGAGTVADGASTVAGARLASAPPPARRTDAAFVEVAGTLPVLADLGFTVAGRHRTKPVTWWRSGDANVVVNETPRSATSADQSSALGVVAPPVGAVAARAKTLLWPAVDRTRGEGEALLPGITSPSGLHVFVSAAPGEDDDWRRDFEPVVDLPATAPASGLGNSPGLLGIDHVGVAVPPEHFNQEMAFFRTLFDLTPGAVEEFIEPHGRLRSRALRPAAGDLRVVLNVEDVGPGHVRRPGINQVAFACTDVVGQVRALRARGVPLMAVPDNYYVDLDARFGLPRAFLEELREHQLLYDRVGDGELMHAYTAVLPTGFYVEMLERRGGYDGYGSAGTHVRLAAQAAQAAQAAR